MAVEKKNGNWVIKGKIKKDDGTYYNYRRIVPDARKKSDAQAFEVDFKRNYQDVEKAKTSINFEELSKEYLINAKNIKTSSARTYKDIIAKACNEFGTKKINLITRELLQKYINKLEKEFSKSYVQKNFYIVKAVFDFGVERDFIMVNPAIKVRMSLRRDEIKKEMLYWEPIQFNQFISVVNEDDAKAFFIFLYYMGCRKGEALAIQWKDVDFKKNIVSINKTVTNKIDGELWSLTSPKTKNSIRNISMPKTVSETLRKQNCTHKNYYGYNEDCFVFGFNRPMPTENYRRKMVKYIKIANENSIVQIPAIRIHDLRHSHASYLLNNMSDRFTDFDVAKRLGDTVQTLHSTYAHWFRQADKGIIEFMDNDI